ncbi:MAG: hypothetical protein JO061_24745, partial [Acidobacteriaceae bacterium]|nr:hypothetical protein [Acidobacteriaceae bacterium]
MRRFALALLLTLPVFATGTVTCTGTPSDTTNIQNALNGGDTVTIVGTCDITGPITLNSNTIIQGSGSNGNANEYGATTNTKLNASGGYYILQSSGNENTITRITFQGGGIELTNDDFTNWTGQYGWTITNNTFQNITSTIRNRNAAIFVDNIVGKGSTGCAPGSACAHSTISGNYFHNIWPNSYPDTSTNRDQAGGAIFFNNGIDNTTVDSNHCNQVYGNCIKGFLDGFEGFVAGSSNAYTATKIVISNNDIQQEGRFGIEFQSVGKNSCPGNNFSNCVINNAGTVVKGNYYHNLFTAMDNNFAFSLLFGGTNGQYINNTAVNGNGSSGSCKERLGIALESGLSGGTVQGNVMSSVALASPCAMDGTGNPVGWQSIEMSGYDYSGTDTWSNNVYCQPNDNWHNLDPDANATYVFQYEYQNTSCPSRSTNESSSITPAFTSANNQD